MFICQVESDFHEFLYRIAVNILVLSCLVNNLTQSTKTSSLIPDGYFDYVVHRLFVVGSVWTLRIYIMLLFSLVGIERDPVSTRSSKGWLCDAIETLAWGSVSRFRLIFPKVEGHELWRFSCNRGILLEKYGKTVLTNNWGTKQYVTMDPTLMQTVVALEVDKFGVAPLNHPMCSPLLGEGIMTVHGHAVSIIDDIILQFKPRSLYIFLINY